MEKKVLKLSVQIKASKEKIWKVLLDDKTYRIWTAAFHPGSYAESDWNEGSKVLFKTPEGDGLVSRVTEHIPNSIITIEHLGVLSNGVEDFDNEEVKKWQGYKESYFISDSMDGVQQLSIEQDISDDYYENFTKIWREALLKVKQLAEN